MLIRTISAEWLKLRHSRLWLILVILPITSVLIGSANFYMNQGVLTKEWYSLWSQVGLFYGEFFLPILIAICCAYLWRLEHFNNNWNLIMTAPISAANIFLAKWLVASLLMIMVQGTFFLLYFGAGLLLGLGSGLPPELWGWLFRGWVASLTISSFQLTLSMRWRSFAVPIGVGLCATFFGLGMYVSEWGFFFPHSLLTIGMGILSQAGFASLKDHLLFFIINLLYTLMFCLLALNWLKKRLFSQGG